MKISWLHRHGWLWVVAMVGCSFPEAIAQNDADLFRAAFPLDSLKDVAASDVKVAANFLLRDIVEAQGYRSEVSTPVTHDVLISDIFKDRYDAFVIFAYQYLKYKDQYPMIPQVVTSHEGSDPKQSLVLLIKDGRKLEDIRKGALLIQSGSGNLVDIWLKNEFRVRGLVLGDHFSEIVLKDNVSQALLPVFFGKADAAICMAKSFELMMELNPQIGRVLSVQGKSEPLISTMICLRGGFQERKPNTLKRVALSLHESTQGRQLLTMMGVDRFVPFDPEDLTGIGKMIEAERLASGKNGIENLDPIKVKLQ